MAGPYRAAGPMIQMSETPVRPKSPSPALGEHTDEILKELGYSPRQIARLKDEETESQRTVGAGMAASILIQNAEKAAAQQPVDKRGGGRYA